MKNLSWFVLVVSIAVIVSSCAKSDDSKTASTDNTTSSSTPTYTYATPTSGATASGTITLGNYSISGTYATVCFSASDSTVPTDVTHIGFVAVVTSSDSYRRETNYYKDSTCSAETLSLGWYYNMDNVTIGDASGSAYKQTYTEVNQTFLAKTTAADTYITAQWKAAGLDIDFEVGTAKVLTTGYFNYNLIKVSDGNLYFGSQSTSAYPSTVSSSKYVKQ